MPTYEGSGEPASIALRLKRVEAILENLQPGEGAPPDIEQALDRLYDMTLRGGLHTSGDVTADMVDGMFWFRQQSLSSADKKSIVSVTYGDTDALNRVKDMPLMKQVLGVDAAWNFARTDPSADQDRASLVGNIYGHKSVYADMRDREQTVVGIVGTQEQLTTLYDDHGSVWRALYGIYYDIDDDAKTKSLLEMVRDLRDENNDLRSRIEWLEAHV
ncbi:hypothetical protein HB770_04215 [Rhizobium leguminosarum bv. viciae]|uniref:Uncharacterized protein n=1 Tax=Rhizobium leguminosarum bv. viciae TaxID=387 RepID=A0A7G6RHW8_RHILV|nr:hypothetical protein HB770_04215 [Rhizobium leguminosarum bv. viciae]